MCLAIPGKLIDVYEEHGMRMGKIDYSGTVNRACLAYVDDANEGDYVLVHAGFALSVLDEEEAQKSLAIWDELVQMAAAEGTDVFGMPLEETGSSDSAEHEESEESKSEGETA